mgnify:CR=1 FL=1
MKLTLPILTIAATIFAGAASAFDPVDVQKLKDTFKCAECDLRNADLWRTILSGADLSGASLKDAKLGYASMNGAILCNTTMPDGSVIYSGC